MLARSAWRIRADVAWLPTRSNRCESEENAGASLIFVQLRLYRPHGRLQRREVILNDIPDQLVGNPMVLVAKDVADPDDLRPRNMRLTSSVAECAAPLPIRSRPRAGRRAARASPHEIRSSVFPRVAFSMPMIASRMARSAGRTSRSVKRHARPKLRSDPEAEGPGCHAWSRRRERPTDAPATA